MTLGFPSREIRGSFVGNSTVLLYNRKLFGCCKEFVLDFENLSHTLASGCGVNVSNQHPTMSINDAIDIFNKESGRDLSPLTVEMMLAGTFNWLEKLLSLYEVQGLEEVLKLYYKYWLHRLVHILLAISLTK